LNVKVYIENADKSNLDEKCTKNLRIVRNDICNGVLHRGLS